MSGIRAALGYAGSEVQWLGTSAYATICGNTIRVEDKGSQFTLSGKGTGISCFATNSEHKLLVYADKSSPPQLYVYQYSGKGAGFVEQTVLEDAAELDVTAVAISWDGERIATASSDPDRKLIVWDWTQREILTTAKLTSPVSMISFNPYDSKRICTSGSGEMHLWETEEAVDAVNLTPKQCSVPGLVPNTHAWCPLEGSVYMGCAGGEIALFNSKTGEAILSRVTPDKDLLPIMASLSDEESLPIRSMAVNREALVVAGDAGYVRWFLHPTHLGAPLGEAIDVECGVRGMCSLAMGGPRTDQVLAGSSDASLFAMEVPPNAGGEAEPEKLGDFHLGRVTAAVPLSDTEHFATCGEDGTLRLWSSKTGGLVAKRQFGTVQNCLASSENSACIAMGSESGIVRVLNTQDVDEVAVAFCSKLHKEAVTHVAFSPTASMVMSYSAADGRMFICTVVGSVIRTMGFIKLPGPPPLLDVGWAGTDEETSMIVASLATGELMSITPPAWGTMVSETLQFGPRDYIVRRVKVDGPINKVAVLPGLEAPTVIGVGTDRVLRRFQTRRDAAFWGGMAGRMVVPEEKSSDAMMKPAGAIHAMRGGAYIAVAGLDGSVKIVSSTVSSSPVAVSNPHDNLLGGVTAVAMNMTGKFVITGGADGSVFISSALPDRLAIPAPPVPESGPVYDVDSPDESMQHDEIDARVKKEADKLHKDTEGERDAVRKALGQLQKIFTDILEVNKQAPELEKLARKDFIIDEQMCKNLQKEGLEKVLAIKREIQKETVRMKLLRERTLTSTRDQMAVGSHTVVGIKNPALEVNNYPLQKQGPETWKLKKAIFLRKVEMKMQRQQFHINGDLAYRVTFDDNGAPLPDKRLQQLEVQDEELLTDTASAAATDSKNLRDLIYSDLDLHCRTRKVTQSLIMTELIREAKEAYNKEFKVLQDRKSKDSDKLADLNGRIEGCAKELFKITGDQEALDKEMSELFHVNNDDEREHDDLKFAVSDSEVGVDKYVSPEEEERLEREAKEEAERQAKAAGDGSVQRALTMMMGGTLDRPDDGNAEFQVERPAFLDADPKTWTEEQFKEAKDFEVRQKSAAEEMAKKVQTVETELKTLKVSVEDICLKFDEAVNVMIGQKHHMDSQVYQMEFRVVRLLYSVDTSVSFSDAEETRLMLEAEQLRLKKDQGNSALTDTRHKVEDRREKVEALLAEDKAMEKSFKKDFAGADDFVTALYHLFRRRVSKAGNPAAKAQRALERPMSAASSVAGHAGLDDAADDEDVESLAPFPGAGTSTNSAQQEPPLNKATDCPAGLDSHWWEQVVNVRGKKLELEEQIRLETRALKMLQHHLHKLSSEDTQLRAALAAKNKEVEEFRASKAGADMDLEVPVSLRQGQVETESQSGSVSDLNQAVLLNRKYVMDVNAIIRQKGGKKVAILTAIKDFKKGSYELEWTNTKLDREAEDLVEKTKELQLLRVTKGLQEALKRGDDTDATPQENTNIEALIKHNSQLHDKNLREREKKLHNIMKTCQEKQLQNYECQHQIQLMQTRLSEQTRIQQSQQGSGDITPAKRMKSMVTHKRLKDISKAQSDEIQMLRAEVERLNLRTYPSFVEQTTYYPDEETMI